MTRILSLALLSAVSSVAPALAQGAPDFASVLADPDNLPLNLAYARGRLAAGDPQAAASALERVLLIEPDADGARLLYAQTLYRLGDLEGAERELALLDARALSPAQAAEVDDLLARARAGSKATRGRAQVFLGVRGDTNPTLSPAARDLEAADTALVAGAELRYEHELGGPGTVAFLDFGLRAEDWTHLDQFDGTRARMQAGLTIAAGDLTISPYVLGEAETLSDGTDVTQTGFGLSLDYGLSATTALTLRAERRDRDYDGGAVSGRDDRLDAIAIGVDHVAGATTLSATLGYARSEAARTAFGYEGPVARLSAQTDLGQGRYILGELGYERRDHAGPDPSGPAGRDRRDDRTRLGLYYGAPLGLGGGLLDDLTVQVGVVHDRRDSNIDRYTADSTTIEVLFVRRFEF